MFSDGGVASMHKVLLLLRCLMRSHALIGEIQRSS